MAPLLTPQEVAALLAVSRRTVQRLAESGELPHIRVGSQLRFSAASLADWQARRETGDRAASSAPAAERPVSARLPVQILPADYVPVFGHLAAAPAASKKRAPRGR